MMGITVPRLLSSQRRLPIVVRGYIAAALGVLAATALIGAIKGVTHVGNISLLYLMVVLWLAATFGRVPAVLASLLSFLSYDFFFIPPFHRFTVDDPSEWVSLLALLATALVLGQLTATVRAHAQASEENQRRTESLYELSQIIANSTNDASLLEALLPRLVDTLAPIGVQGCACLRPNAEGVLETQFVVPSRATLPGPVREMLEASTRAYAAHAAWTLQNGLVVGTLARLDLEDHTFARDSHCFYVPLCAGPRSIGVLSVVGAESIRQLVTSANGAQRSQAPNASITTLFRTICDQLAVALDRAALQGEAIHTEALHESDRLKTLLLGSVTHDLRTPLASIKAAATSLLTPSLPWTETERNELLETIDRSADRLNRLVGNLLDLSRLEAGVALPDKEWHLIDEIIATVLDRLEVAGYLEHREIDVKVPDDVPLVFVDHTQIEQVLANLIENALKYSAVGSAIRIRAAMVDSSSLGHALEVRVTDSGIGIPPHELQAIFGKFYRIHHVQSPWESVRPAVGTGLGLAICANIVHAHGGEIWAESQVGEGSTFVFRLPVSEQAPSGLLPDVEYVR